jgi:hypothetical protein
VHLECDGGVPFVFPCERITGHNPLLHPQSEFEAAQSAIKQARAECAAWNKQFAPEPPKRKTKTQN